MAEAFLRVRLAENGVDATVSSAGFLAEGAPATGPVIDTMAAVGLDLTGHLSRQVTPTMAEAADLIVTMTRQHQIELTLMAPETWRRTFQLRDLVRRAELVGRRAAEQTFADWLILVGEGRTRASVLSGRLNDDIADPIGQSAAVHERTRRLLDDQLSSLARLL